MSSIWNRGLQFSVFGESHGEAIGVVVDNIPAGIKLNLKRMQKFMNRRAPNILKLGSSARNEPDKFKILSGVFNGKTSGSPICALIFNENFKSQTYEELKNFLRPGHADFTAKMRYGGFNNFLGSGHLSGRLTAPLVFVGALCEQLLLIKNVKTFAHVASVGKIFDFSFLDKKFYIEELYKLKQKPLAVLNDDIIPKIKNEVRTQSLNSNSVGGSVECCIFGVKPGLGSPMFDKIENYLADLVFSVPAVKGIEFGAGFKVAEMTGLENNDEFLIEKGKIKTKTNNHGGVLGGISSGMPIVFRVAIKPTPTIFKKQKTVDFKNKIEAEVCFNGNHDSCIVLRAVAVIEAVANIAIVSQFLNQGKFKMEGYFEKTDC